jgi:hypothetical protein
MNTARQPMIDLIKEVIAGTPPIVIDASEHPHRARIACQLLESGYLNGPPPARTSGAQLNKVVIYDVTVEGRRLCDALEKELDSGRFIVKAGSTLKRGSIIAMSGAWGIIGGVLGAALTEVVLRRFHLK